MKEPLDDEMGEEKKMFWRSSLTPSPPDQTLRLDAEQKTKANILGKRKRVKGGAGGVEAAAAQTCEYR